MKSDDGLSLILRYSGACLLRERLPDPRLLSARDLDFDLCLSLLRGPDLDLDLCRSLERRLQQVWPESNCSHEQWG